MCHYFLAGMYDQGNLIFSGELNVIIQKNAIMVKHAIVSNYSGGNRKYFPATKTEGVLFSSTM